MFLILFCLALAIQVLFSLRQQLRYFKTRPSRIYGMPPRLFGLVQLPALTEWQFHLSGIVFALSLILAALGLWPRVFIFVALLCYFPYFNSIMSLAYIQRKTNLLPFVLLVLLVTPSSSMALAQPAPVWPIALIKIALAQMYFSAGLQKLRLAGFKWCDGRSLQAYLVEHYLWGDMGRAWALAQRPRLCVALSCLLLLFELTFWIVLVVPVLNLPYAVAGLVFHLGAALTMRINYLKYLGPVYMVFVTGIAFDLLERFHFTVR
jgi:hypothetical protein